MASSTSVGPLAYSCGASSGSRATSCYKRYMLVHVVTTLVQEHLLERPSDKASTGPRPSHTPRISCSAVKGASSTLDKLTSRCRRFRQSPSRGLSSSGTSTWWGRSDKRPGHSPTSSWWLESSPSGSRLDPSSMPAPRRRYRSSPTSSIASAYPTQSSLRTAPSSWGRNSSTSATTTISVWTGQLLPTRR
jgi:hypothetical protein